MEIARETRQHHEHARQMFGVHGQRVQILLVSLRGMRGLVVRVAALRRNNNLIAIKIQLKEQLNEQFNNN